MKLLLATALAAVFIVSARGDGKIEDSVPETAEVDQQQESLCDKYPNMNICQLQDVANGALEEVQIIIDGLTSNELPAGEEWLQIGSRVTPSPNYRPGSDNPLVCTNTRS